MYGFGQVPLKMLMRAFALSRNARGVWWCMVAVLCRRERPNRYFLAEVKNLMSYMEEFFDSSALNAIDHVHDALQQKRDGAQQWSNTHRSHRERLATRSELTSPSAGTVEMDWPLDHVVKQFDEELEFDRLIGRAQFSPEDLVYWWREDRAAFLTRRQPEHPLYPSKDPSRPRV
ncbi:hypothetical protein N7470_006281 [Penicillium chermesinum]|nr:hypothetical protein N7470_006281 [Penicillium chermesinum]